MCGIAGIARFAGLTPAERGLGAAMAARLHHRGPDEQGAFEDRCASMGHTRLSVIDPEAGRQPMGNEDGSIQVVFNGEIYNHRLLAERLRSHGHRLRTRCDTEVIAHLYEDFGDAFVEHLNGMFAIALWDAPRRRLVLVRDRLGVKPLFWHDDGQRILFGSELKAVLAGGGLSKRVDPCALADFLSFGHVPAPRTIFEGIRKLEPGFIATCTASGVALRRYWDVPFNDEGSTQPSPQETEYWIDAFDELLSDAVRIRLEADVPLGAFLSSGVDSSAVVEAMRRHALGPVLTHTVGFDEADHDERAQARAIARQLGTDHREVIVRADAAGAAERLIRQFDEPFADPCAVPMLYLSQAARDRVTVALSGDGPDELLAGYRRYRFDLAEHTLRAAAPAWLRRSTAGVAGWLYPKADWLPRSLRAKRTLQNLACDDVTAHLRSVSIIGGELPASLLRPEIVTAMHGHDPFSRGRDLFNRCGSTSLLNRLLYLDIKTLLADEILTKVDRASMAVALEVRVPMLDYRLVELSARIPASLKLHGNEGKWILRRVVERRLGRHVATHEKRGFDVPTDAWFRGPLRGLARDTLLSPEAVSREWIEPRVTERMLTGHLSGNQSNGRALWALLMLELWGRAYTTPNQDSRPTDNSFRIIHRRPQPAGGRV